MGISRQKQTPGDRAMENPSETAVLLKQLEINERAVVYLNGPRLSCIRGREMFLVVTISEDKTSI